MSPVAVRVFAVGVCAAFALVLTPRLNAEPQAPANPPTTQPGAKASFETIKSLAGRWERTQAGPDGKPVISNIDFKVTAGGSAVVETMFPGEAHEMTNVYHLDGDSIIVVHYCAGGNQPRMRLDSTDGKVISFKFMDVTNLPQPDGKCMGALTLEIGDGTLTENWGTIKKSTGEVTPYIKLELKKVS